MTSRAEILDVILEEIDCYDPKIPDLEREEWDEVEDAVYRKVVETVGDAVVENTVTVICLEVMPDASPAIRQAIGGALKENQVFYRLLQRCDYRLPERYRKAGGNALEVIVGMWSLKRTRKEAKRMAMQIFEPLARAAWKRMETHPHPPAPPSRAGLELEEQSIGLSKPRPYKLPPAASFTFANPES
ncbi:hypothetical protein B0H11DRAFT_2237523 [Mycena galericulata]|nr:hypothetical protein B0H11DRAFT_2237523 [Mycena galericulata]